MEDVLRKMYLKKHSQIQKRKKDGQLLIEQPKVRNRLHKSIWQDYRPLIQPFDLQQQVNIKKKLEYGNDFVLQKHRYKIQNVLSPNLDSSVKLPSINKRLSQNYGKNQLEKQKQIEEIQQNVNKRNPHRLKARTQEVYIKYRRRRVLRCFRVRVLMIIFIRRISKLRKRSLIDKRQITQEYSSRLLQIIERMVNQYYVTELEEQLLKYLQIIRVKISQPKLMLEKQVLNMLYFTSKQLAKSSVVKDLMNFLILISGEYSFFPPDYLTVTEICRLQFNPRYGNHQNVNQQKSKMLIAICGGIKIFCSYILYRPWFMKIQKSPIKPEDILNNYQSVRN